MSRDALVVGINTYDRLKCLNAPAADGEAIAQILQQYGEFRVTRLPAVKDKENETIRIGKQTKVSLTQLEKAIVQLFKPDGKPPDTALLYFSGHGLRKNVGIQEGFLATSEVNPEAGNWGLSLQWLRRLLQESEVRQQIVILDCCYSGEVLNFAEADPGDRGKGRDRCFIAASRDFEVAFEEISSQHSVLTAALLKGLEPKQDRWVSNYTLVDLLNQEHHAFPQRPIFANSGEAINLTRKWNSSPVNSIVQVSATCPYKGLSYFDCTEADANLFYGRTALTDELLEKVRSGNFLAVLGASGSGKSSVVRAGLLYQLKLGRRLSGSDTWQLKIFRPGINPLQSLALAFVESELSDIERGSQLAKAEELIAKGAVGLGQLITAAQTQRVMLVVDQFEEAFTQCQDITKRQQFFECVLGALQRDDNKLCLIITMRADFFGKCLEQEYGGLAKKIQEYLVTVTPMIREELETAIIKPAQQVNLAVEPELVSQMIADVENSPGSLPLLQYTLTELWQQRTEERLTLTTYSKLGGVRGTLQTRATEVYESLSLEEQQATKRIFLELTQLGEGTEDTRRQVVQRDLVTSQHPEAVINRIIQRLANEKLVVTSTLSNQIAVVDVAHEALIRHWLLLRKWIEESRDVLRQKRKIEAAAIEWRDRRKAKDYLLQGKRLREAENFQKQQTENLRLSDLAIEFIQASVRQRRNNRFRSIAVFLIIPLGLSVYVGVIIEKQIRINELWQRVDAVKGKEYSLVKIRALEKLVQAGESLINKDFSGANLRGADLSSADLRGAKLNDADLTSANLRGAKLNDADLTSAKLNHAYLRDADLRDADLTSAKLMHAKLMRANLSGLWGTNLRDAKLNHAYLRDADLSYAILSSADLSSADLSSANLSYANLSSADLSSADLSSADLSSADLSSANLNHADLTSANLTSAKLNGTDLSSAHLTSAKLSGAYLSSAYLSSAYLSGANLTSAKLSGANLSSAKLNGTDLKGADLSGANLSSAYLSSVNLSGANLSRAKLSSINLSDANLSRANLSAAIYTKQTEFPPNFNLDDKQMYLIGPNANLKDADLKGALLYYEDLQHADLSNAKLNYANLGIANLSDAKLSNADFSNADLSDAKFGGADISYTNFKGAKNLTLQQVKSAKNWDKAKYDKDFRAKLGLPPEPAK
ncbi:pentapeptide repeat-containing protein [Nostoc sp. CHAB 5784]|uniref:nSTAND1 domain-containing NTPase n=1 Tax=Nostoc mirabile TaxID=2907820 RepID=UPI001E52C4A7|nr:pentapeptide repeat-containing protein [Nostoc mirabile]MCC5666505.1 pentapeptide repeat-containing protein [Nostoc mirabile CHAB5784]